VARALVPLAVARDIRASTERRLRRIVALPIAPGRPRMAARWLRVEWLLALGLFDRRRWFAGQREVVSRRHRRRR
jgi:hypothetical protein